MAKIRRIPRAFQDTKGVPGQYTTDPAVAPPEQIEAIGKAYDKAKRIGKGKQLFTPLSVGKPIVAQLDGVSTSASNAPGSVAPTRNRRVRRGGSIKTSVSFRNMVMRDPSISVIPTAGLNVDDLPPSYKAALQMLQTKVRLMEADPESTEEFVRFRELLQRRTDQESEQARLRSMFRRFDNLYHPTTMTLGGADHWPEDPSARLAGRAHISVNVHPAYVNIPASLQAVRPVINYVPSNTDPESRTLAAERERLFFRWWEENDFDLLLEDACTLKALYGHTAAKIYWDPYLQIPRISIVESPENLYLGYGSSDFRRIDW